jgi:two-component system, NtrC family, response regulator AtoC
VDIPMESVLNVERREARIHALLVDSYAGSREGLRASLEAESCFVEVAADAQHGVALMRAGGFDLAVIDLGLLPTRGIAWSVWELARLFRVFNPSAPLVLLAAELRRDLEAEAACVCPALVFEKPINPARLRAVVRELRTESARG